MLVPLSGGNLLQEAIRTFAQSGQRWSAEKEFISSGAAQAQQCRSGFFRLCSHVLLYARNMGKTRLFRSNMTRYYSATPVQSGMGRPLPL